jgi:hypothetical protein
MGVMSLERYKLIMLTPSRRALSQIGPVCKAELPYIIFAPEIIENSPHTEPARTRLFTRRTDRRAPSIRNNRTQGTKEIEYHTRNVVVTHRQTNTA